jgi:DNA modification methylase
MKPSTNSPDRLPRFNHLHLIEVEISDLVIPDRQLRTHSPQQIRKIAQSIREFGFVVPILVDARNEVISGMARIKAARQVGLTHAPAIRIESLTPAQVRALRIADNRLAEEADWDREALRLEIEDLLELDIDIELTGFEMGEIDVLMDEDDSSGADPDEDIPEPPVSPVSRVGDIWQIGDHLLACGDALAPETYAILDGTLVDAVFVDAPYNVKIDKNVCGLGKHKHDEFVQASGEMSKAEFFAFLSSAHQRLAEAIKPGGVIFSCMDWRSIAPLIQAGEEAGLELLNLAVWDKGVGGMGSLYRSRHELVGILRKPGASHTNNVELGKHGRNRTNVWEYAGMNCATKERDALLTIHPTVKPVALVADALMDVTKRGERVLDCFGGSGTTMVAAEKTGRRAILVELDPKYVDVIIARMGQSFGLDAIHVETGESFAAAKAQRLSSPLDQADVNAAA